VGRARLILVPAALAALLVSGCGGDGGSDLAERADPICARANVALSELKRPQSLEQLLNYVEGASEIVEQRRADLAALEVSGDDADDWDAFLEANDRAVAALVELRESTVTGRGGEEASRAFETAEADARRLADELGLRQCALEPPRPVDEEDEEEPAPPPTTTEAETETDAGGPKSSWAEQADAVCGEAQGRIDALPQPTDPLSAAAQIGQVSAIVKEEIADLRELEPPPGQEARVEGFIGALGRGANSLDRLVQAMTDQDEDAVDRFIEEGENAAEQAQREADALGLTVCGRG
jgi:hypothetical protein